MRWGPLGSRPHNPSEPLYNLYYGIHQVELTPLERMVISNRYTYVVVRKYIRPWGGGGCYLQKKTSTRQRRGELLNQTSPQVSSYSLCTVLADEGRQERRRRMAGERCMTLSSVLLRNKFSRRQSGRWTIAL